FFFFSSRRRHTRSKRDWSSDVCSSDLEAGEQTPTPPTLLGRGGLRRGGGRDSAGGRAGLRPGGGGGLLPSDVLGHIHQSRITLCYRTQAEKFAYGRKNA